MSQLQNLQLNTINLYHFYHIIARQFRSSPPTSMSNDRDLITLPYVASTGPYWMWPNHFSLFSINFFLIGATATISQMFSFLNWCLFDDVKCYKVGHFFACILAIHNLYLFFFKIFYQFCLFKRFYLNINQIRCFFPITKRLF